MTRSRLELSPGLWLDARRAAWLEEHRALLVADTHLGYAWAHRHRGNLLPVGPCDETVARLQALVEEYAPAELFIVGDVVHAWVPAEAVAADLRRLHALGVPVRLLAGNHDRHLARMLADAGLANEVARERPLGPHLLLHGDEPPARPHPGPGRLILGHEHPALALSDGVATSARCPCFLVGDDRLVLPAFTDWSRGTDVRGGRFLSPCLQQARFVQAVAILAGKLLPIPL